MNALPAIGEKLYLPKTSRAKAMALVLGLNIEEDEKRFAGN
ncbi:MAG TPA: hypothetical protein VF932_13125 [Anaerolineae bacterium]